jgi:hypothetical protein
MDEEYDDLGEISIDDADDSNIPVDIWLKKVKEEDDEGDREHAGMWRLTADNYMPRRGRLSGENSYKAFSKERETLVKLVHKHWLPLYKTAVEILTEMKPSETHDNGTACLYYWQKE